MIYPKAKRRNHERFSSKNFSATCSSFSRGRNGFAHECFLIYHNPNGSNIYVEGLSKWINRTWERFTYESCILDAINELPAELQAMAKEELIEARFKKEVEETEKFLSDFESEYKKLPDSTKEKLKDVELTSMEQAESLVNSMKMFNVLTELMK